MKLLIIGQTPPPYGGQAVNIQRILDILSENDFDYHFIRFNFSDEMSDNGQVKIGKLWRLILICFNLVKELILFKPDYVYYPPSGPEKIPVYRDLVIVSIIRLFGKKTIFHFHAGGLSEIYPTLNSILKRLFKYCFFFPDYSICMSEHGKKDPEFIGSKHVEVIPYGVREPLQIREYTLKSANYTVLFVGVCRETKGIIDFIQVIEKANNFNSHIKGRILGTIFSEKEKSAIDSAVTKNLISYEGVKLGKEKDIIFLESHIFLFPTFFEHENFPTVNLEAFSYGLPVVSTKWRGVNDQIRHGENGYLHEIHDIEGMANSIIKLVNDKLLYKSISINAINDYNNLYKSAHFEYNILNFFNKLL